MDQNEVRRLARTRAAELNIPWDDSSVWVSRPFLGRFVGQWRLAWHVDTLGSDARMLMVLDERTGGITRLWATNVEAVSIQIGPTVSRSLGVGGWLLVASSLALGVVATLCLYVAFSAIAIPVVLGVVLASAGGCVVTASAVWLCERRELRRAVELTAGLPRP